MWVKLYSEVWLWRVWFSRALSDINADRRTLWLMMRRCVVVIRLYGCVIRYRIITRSRKRIRCWILHVKQNIFGILCMKPVIWTFSCLICCIIISVLCLFAFHFIFFSKFCLTLIFLPAVVWRWWNRSFRATLYLPRYSRHSCAQLHWEQEDLPPQNLFCLSNWKKKPIKNFAMGYSPQPISPFTRQTEREARALRGNLPRWVGTTYHSHAITH